jgi:hypothetical protein
MNLLGDWQTPSGHIRRQPDAQQPPLPAVGADQRDIDHALLVPGRVVWRYCESTRGDRLRSTVPCCHRSITLSEDTEHAVCCACRLAYAVIVKDEGDDGWGNRSYSAAFTVSHTITVARHRPRRR